jgi:hypothetical protein
LQEAILISMTIHMVILFIKSFFKLLIIQPSFQDHPGNKTMIILFTIPSFGWMTDALSSSISIHPNVLFKFPQRFSTG